MPRTRPPYPEALRQQIIELARADRSVSELAEEFELSDQTIRSWIKQADLDGSFRSDGATTAGREEPRRLQGEPPVEAGEKHPGKTQESLRYGLVRTGDQRRATKVRVRRSAPGLVFSHRDVPRVLEVSKG